MELVRRSVDAGICTLTLDSPHNRNALSRQLIAELLDGLAAAEADPEVRAILVAHEGKVFCSGADLAEASSADANEAPRSMIEVQRAIVSSSKPVVVAVGGAARAGGLGIIAAADVAVAAEEATFALTEVRLGLAPAVISAPLLARMNTRAAQQTFLTAEPFDGRAAAEHGLVTCAVPREKLDEEVGRVCAALAKGHPQGLRETKKLLNRQICRDLDDQGPALADLSVRLFASDEAKQAMRAFLDSRRR